MNINQIKFLSKKSDNYSFYYYKIFNLTKQLDNALRNKNKIINSFYDYFSLNFKLYKKDVMEELYEFLKTINDKEILYDEEINKMIHTPWIIYFYFKDETYFDTSTDIFKEYIKDVCLLGIENDILCTHLLIIKNQKLNMLVNAENIYLYKVPKFLY
jgi:hypothetical protein